MCVSAHMWSYRGTYVYVLVVENRSPPWMWSFRKCPHSFLRTRPFTDLQFISYSGQWCTGSCLWEPWTGITSTGHLAPLLQDYFNFLFLYLVDLFFVNLILEHNTFWFHLTPVFSCSSHTSSPPSSHQFSLPWSDLFALFCSFVCLLWGFVHLFVCFDFPFEPLSLTGHTHMDIDVRLSTSAWLVHLWVFHWRQCHLFLL